MHISKFVCQSVQNVLEVSANGVTELPVSFKTHGKALFFHVLENCPTIWSSSEGDSKISYIPCENRHFTIQALYLHSGIHLEIKQTAWKISAKFPAP